MEKALNNAVPEIQEPAPSLEYTTIKNTQIRICVGDLTQQTTDAVLILNNNNLCLTQGGQLNRQIAKAAGFSLIEECLVIVTKGGARLPGEAIMTGSGNLPCKHLIHAITYPGPPRILDLLMSVKKGLQLADAKGLGSIALPAIGAGDMLLSLVESVRVLSGGILSFLALPPQSLREIKVVLFLESMLWPYSQEMKKEFVPFVTLEEYSQLSRAWDDKDDYIPVLHPSSAAENTNDKSNTKNFPATTTEQQTDIERRKLVAQNVRWHCVIQGKEIGFNDKVSAIIEDARNRKCNGVSLKVNDCEYRVDFSSMTVLYSQSKCTALPLNWTLVAESGDSSPDFWSRQPCFPDGVPVPVAMVTLMPSEGEYKHVTNMFYSTGGKGNITSIERVQNLHLYKQYTTYRQQVENMNSRSGFNNQNERQLFHGTKGCNLRAINLQGFNRSFSGINGAVYGNGVYFAANASYSMDYTEPDNNNLRHMYLARVVVGFFVEGDIGLRAPPPLFHEVPEFLFDSVVDDIQDPSVFVVFRDFQCYPEYLITIRQ